MINISGRNVDFNELNINNFSKRPLFDSLKVFWKESEIAYFDFLKNNNIDFYRNYNSMAELKDSVNSELEIIKNLVKQNAKLPFDFKIIDTIKKLQDIKNHEFVKFNIDLKEISDKNTKQQIKDIFLDTKSVSLIEFVDIQDDICSLIYHRKGAFYYENEPFLTTARDQISMLENYKEPKDNNFITARFLQDFALKLKEANINESFVLNYSNNEKNIKNINEILQYRNLSREEKTKLKNEENLKKEAIVLAKNELKEEMNSNRKSLNQVETSEVLKAPQANLYNINNISNLAKFQTNNDKPSIAEMVAKNIELYRQKELEKTKERLEKAEKDAQKAYYDLKEYLGNGASINEALKNITQKYRNDDTINFASLLFSQDILNIFEKENIIKELENDKLNLGKELKDAYDRIEQKDESISKIRSTLQTKINEMERFKYEYEKEYELKVKEQEQLLELEIDKFKKEQDDIISGYEVEIKEIEQRNEDLFNENKLLNNEKIKLEFENKNINSKLLDNENNMKILQSENTNLKINIQNLQNELKNSNTQETYKMELKIENLLEKEKDYKERIVILEDRLNSFMQKLISNQSQDEKPQIRAKDILGSVSK